MLPAVSIMFFIALSDANHCKQKNHVSGPWQPVSSCQDLDTKRLHGSMEVLIQLARRIFQL